MYRVITKFGKTYNFVTEWRKWDFDDSFIFFKWDGGKELIIHFNDIEVIEQVIK
jgi:hypothetical protein